MGDVVLFPRHKLHSWVRDNGEDTGLMVCSTCGGTEGSLTEHCPQRLMTDAEEREVYMGRLDFRRQHGGWTTWTREAEIAVRRTLE
jgi:hypothetical protein